MFRLFFFLEIDISSTLFVDPIVVCASLILYQ